MDITSLPLILMVNFFKIARPSLNHDVVGIFTVQRDRKGQPCGSVDNHFVFDKVWDAARIVGDDHRLSHSFDT